MTFHNTSNEQSIHTTSMQQQSQQDGLAKSPVAAVHPERPPRGFRIPRKLADKFIQIEKPAGCDEKA